MDLLSPALQTLYADLLQQVGTAPAAGSVYARRRDEVDYLYAKIPTGSGRVDRFLGRADDPAAQAQAAAVRSGMAQARERRRLVSMLRRGGLAGPDRTLGPILDVLAFAGLFSNGAVLVGTAAYMNSEGLVGARLPTPTLTTGDVDIATAHLALQAQPPERLESVLKRADPTFEGVPPLRPGAPSSRFRNAEGYLVDLLTPARSRSDENPIPVEGLGAGAAPLQHLAWLISDPVPAVALWGAGIPVRVPQPARFAVHKLILAQRRDPASRLKRQKDLAQARALVDVLQRQDRFALEDALADACAQGVKGWRTPIERSLAELQLEIPHL
jgi:hypothetical protein